MNNINSQSNVHLFPTFLRTKLNKFYDGRVKKDWGGQHIMRGKIATSDSIQLVSNDYLALANHPAVLSAQKSILEDQSRYLLMSAIFLHGDNPQMNLEARLSEFFLSDEAILCQSGYAANVGLIQAIVEDTYAPVYIDITAHMSLWDGIKMADASPTPFRHNDVDHLVHLVRKRGPGLVIVDSVYSTNGSVCPLRNLVNAVHELGCTVLVDESHSFGTHGPQGRGLVVDLGLQDKVMFRTASLAKAFAGRAGLICCPDGFSDFFKFTSKPSIFSSALLPYEIAGLDKTLDLILDADSKREKLRRSTLYLQRHLDRIGYNVGDGAAQIIALESGTESDTILLRDALEQRDIFGSVFCAPATAKNRALMRFSINSELTDMQLRRIVQACTEIAEELRIENWRSSRRKMSRASAQSKLLRIA